MIVEYAVERVPLASLFFGLNEREWYFAQHFDGCIDLLDALRRDAAVHGVTAGRHLYNAFVDREHHLIAILRQNAPGHIDPTAPSLVMVRTDGTWPVAWDWPGASSTDLTVYTLPRSMMERIDHAPLRARAQA